MITLHAPRAVRALLDKHGVAPHKQLGQNFLCDANALETIADAGVVEGEAVLEIGPGLGSLTQQLAMRAKRVVAVEIDKGFLPILAETLADFDNVTIVHADFLKADFASLHRALGGGRFSVCANLPYYISTPILTRLLESKLPITQMTFLLQKEVGDRLAARPGQKNYGSLSVFAQHFAAIETVAKVGASCFVPAPNVDSIVVKLAMRPAPYELTDEALFFKLIRASFAMRRKTLANNLAAAFPIGKEDVQGLLTKIGLDSGVRAEALGVGEFAELSEGILLFLKEK